MKISAIETSVVALPFDMGGPHTRFAGQLWDKMEILLVKVETEDGFVGWGEAFGHACIASTKTAIDTIIAPLVLGRDSRDINALTRSVFHSTHLLGRNGAHVFGFSGVEIALWDIAGKRAGAPIWRLLGGASLAPGRPVWLADGDTPRMELDAYASLLNYGNPALVAKNTTAACEAGYRHIKLHEVTRESTLAAIDAPAAKNAAVMLDVNCAWSPVIARDMAASLADDGLLWLEEPVWPPEDLHGLASVRDLGIPIAAGENVAGLFGFKALIDAGAIDIAQPSVTKIGGIGEMVKVIHLCQAHGVEVLPHSPYFGPGLIASIHIAAALIEKPLVEMLWLEMEANPFDPWVRAEHGKVRVPTAAGLGVEPDPEILSRYAKGETTRVAMGGKA